MQHKDKEFIHKAVEAIREEQNRMLSKGKITFMELQLILPSIAKAWDCIDEIYEDIEEYEEFCQKKGYHEHERHHREHTEHQYGNPRVRY